MKSFAIVLTAVLVSAVALPVHAAERLSDKQAKAIVENIDRGFDANAALLSAAEAAMRSARTAASSSARGPVDPSHAAAAKARRSRGRKRVDRIGYLEWDVTSRGPALRPAHAYRRVLPRPSHRVPGATVTLCAPAGASARTGAVGESAAFR